MKEYSKVAYLAGLSNETRAIMEPVMRNMEATETAHPDDITAWKEIQLRLEQRAQAACERALNQFKPAREEHVIGGMDAMLIHPTAIASGKPVIFLHGGAYVGFSARSILFASIPMAVELERTLLVLDYPLAPASRFSSTVPAAAHAIAAAIAQWGDCYLVGDSAGGGLAVAATLYLLQNSMPAPTALALVSPWVDLSDSGDSRITLRDHDPLLDDEHLAICAQAYTGGQLRDPMASPVYAEFPANFPATFIVCGSREILLSDSLRLHQLLLAADVEATLDVHEGLHHSFPTVTPLTPEARVAKRHIKNFLDSR